MPHRWTLKGDEYHLKDFQVKIMQELLHILEEVFFQS